MPKSDFIKTVEKRMKDNSKVCQNTENPKELVVFANRNLELEWVLNEAKKLL